MSDSVYERIKTSAAAKTGSILYFNNISAISDSGADYEILGKMGYTARKLKRIIRKQVLTFFCIPFLFGLADCIFATIVYKTELMQNLLGNIITLYLPTAAAVACSLLLFILVPKYGTIKITLKRNPAIHILPGIGEKYITKMMRK